MAARLARKRGDPGQEDVGVRAAQGDVVELGVEWLASKAAMAS